IIYSETKEVHITDASVTVMNVHGDKNFQVQGKVTDKVLKAEIPEEDIELVMDQTGVSEDAAKQALEDSDGEPAEAIIKIMGG
ncbi:MAG: Nascent polypeptide-associated complex protein, partial [Candidatus Thermoplasmatota archaeon]|nr:Nascent polypeptide-associated complex protein [Candidatus Thermoplasmatota archaeon]